MFHLHHSQNFVRILLAFFHSIQCSTIHNFSIFCLFPAIFRTLDLLSNSWWESWKIGYCGNSNYRLIWKYNNSRIFINILRFPALWQWSKYIRTSSVACWNKYQRAVNGGRRMIILILMWLSWADKKNIWHSFNSLFWWSWPEREKIGRHTRVYIASPCLPWSVQNLKEEKNFYTK